jgi:hypothetical protein
MNNLLGTTNSTIKVAADSLFQSLIRCVDLAFLVPSWTNTLPFTNVKAKIAILNKLNGNAFKISVICLEMAANLHSKKPTLLTKNVIPVLAKLLDDARAEVKSATKVLLSTLYGLMGKGIIEFVPPNKGQLILEMISAQ